MRGEEAATLYSRLDDLVRASERGQIARTPFLTPEELSLALEYLCRIGMSTRVLDFGGYSEAERRCVYVLPEYLEGLCSYEALLEYIDGKEIAALLICGSGYRVLSHRDYLGSLLALGIERGVLGDIAFESEDTGRAVVFCDATIAKYITAQLCKVANDTVKSRIIEADRGFVPYRKFLHISDTVASERVDCVVAALCSLSRERARELVEGEYVNIDHRICDKPDRAVSASSVISVRGYGKFKINSLSERTKKGRIRLSADKYL